MLKSQYATSKTQNTPKSQKRKNYNGIGGQNKKKRTELRNDTQELEEETSTSKNRYSRKKSHKRDTNVDVDDSFVNSDKSAGSDHNITIIDDDDHESWLASMIHEATQPPRPTNSKKPRKEARQLFPFKCSECPAKYKTEGGFTKHLREKHGLLLCIYHFISIQ